MAHMGYSPTTLQFASGGGAVSCGYPQFNGRIAVPPSASPRISRLPAPPLCGRGPPYIPYRPYGTAWRLRRWASPLLEPSEGPQGTHPERRRKETRGDPSGNPNTLSATPPWLAMPLQTPTPLILWPKARSAAPIWAIHSDMRPLWALTAHTDLAHQLVSSPPGCFLLTERGTAPGLSTEKHHSVIHGIRWGRGAPRRENPSRRL